LFATWDSAATEAVRLTRVFTDQLLASGSDIRLEPEASRHLLTVLRLGPGDPVCLFNGQGGEYAGILQAGSGRQACVSVGAHHAEDRQSPLAICLAIGISRGERMDLIVQKATELGVATIAPLITERTEVRLRGERIDKKLRHWQQIIISACEQCGRNRLPRLLPLQELDQWLANAPAMPQERRFVLHHRAHRQLRQLAEQSCRSTALLIGPEGGLTDEEIRRAETTGYEALQLGPRILRTETAPLAAISVLQSIWGDWL